MMEIYKVETGSLLVAWPYPDIILILDTHAVTRRKQGLAFHVALRRSGCRKSVLVQYVEGRAESLFEQGQLHHPTFRGFSWWDTWPFLRQNTTIMF